MSLTEQAQPRSDSVKTEHLDVIVVGAGLSGIGAAYHIATECPNKTFAILEGRASLGGTWDLFKYPGFRSDSDMFTLGYSFQPWSTSVAIADGPSILSYIRETASRHGIDRKIRYNQRALQASWSSEDALWTLEVVAGSDKTPLRYTCNFLYMCSGYYNYTEGYLPKWQHVERFGGQLVHPQHWPENLDYAGKNVVIIGSGATAVTLAPAMAKTAGHVTILQRSPSYVIALPGEDPIAKLLRRLPKKLSAPLVRWKNLLYGMWFFNLSRKNPDDVKKRIADLQQTVLGPDFDYSHFTPKYNPWDQRLCFVPDGDLFESLKKGDVSFATDTIEHFDETGIALTSGRHLDADIVVTATGLQMQLFGGMTLSVDGRPVELNKTLLYKGMMFSDVPNLATAIGYTNASWTLKCELTSEYVCRLLRHMDKHGYTSCTPLRDPSLTEVPALPLTSGYVQRASEMMPKQGDKKPWRLYQNYLLDLAAMRYGKIVDPHIKFVKRKVASRTKRAA